MDRLNPTLPPLDAATDSMIRIECELAAIVADISEHLTDDDDGQLLELLFGCIRATHALRDARHAVQAGRAAA